MKSTLIKIGSCSLLLFITFLASGQEKIHLTNITGEATVEGNITVKQAKEKALENAKINALRKAGVPEYVNAWKMQLTRQDDSHPNRVFMESLNSEIQGEVIVKNQSAPSKELNEGVIIIRISIDATVKKYESKSDPDFTIHLTGTENYYQEGDYASFKIRPSKDCYLTLFNIATENNHLAKLYPHPKYTDNIKKLKAGKLYTFPFNSDKGLQARLPKNSKKQANRFIFVFTKDKSRFVQHDEKGYIDDHQTIFQWISDIPQHKRRVKLVQFEIIAEDY